ncbi:hypothetical protein M404DRAFT_152387 [Pisolithus tinctorius Marx 270]|uniref:Tyr recombinase domain-containing protein n=1 Tax=Pisolithus tinctorius Marx 270 TaxID=870435 RepID=A0A0C3NHZ4_PISTI|nr:hypothetical protein M404DRAFT_152387 [Pisolithus tinctorius Marx 270]
MSTNTRQPNIPNKPPCPTRLSSLAEHTQPLTPPSTTTSLLPPTIIIPHSRSDPPLVPSPIPRPQCPAKKRLMVWKPLNHRAPSLPFSAIDTQCIYDVITHTWSNSTRETYSLGLLAFHTFCDAKGVPEDQHAPASSELISFFISTMAGLYANTMIVNYTSVLYLNGVRAWHIIHSVPWTLNEIETNTLLKASKSLSPPTSKHPPHVPYMVKVIAKIHTNLDLNLPLNVAVFACLTTIFFATARTSKFTVANLKAFNPSIHITCQNVSIQHNQQGLEVTNFHIPHTKTAPLSEDISWAKQDSPTDPQKALERHFKINDPPQSSHLFAYRTKHGHHPLTRHTFLKTLESTLKKAGLPPLKGHGICIGLTLEYLLRNVPFDVVKVKGRWASDTFLIYLRRHAQILAPYLQSEPKLHNDFLQYTLPPIC